MLTVIEVISCNVVIQIEAEWELVYIVINSPFILKSDQTGITNVGGKNGYAGSLHLTGWFPEILCQSRAVGARYSSPAAAVCEVSSLAKRTRCALARTVTRLRRYGA